MPDSIVFIERTDELAHLNLTLSAAAASRGKIAFITGAAATGRTELLQRFGERAVEAGARWVHASASRAEQGHPFSILTQLFPASPLPAEAGRLLTGSMDGNHGPSDPAPVVPAEILQGLCTELFALSAAGVVLVSVDDVQHADALSLQWLAYLSRRLVSSRIALLLTMAEDAQRAHPVVHGELLGLPHSSLIRIGPLSRQGVCRIVAERAGPGAHGLGGRFHDASGGNPLILRALLEDHFSVGGPQDGGAAPLAGGAFRTTVQAVLHRAHPDMLKVARGLAIAEDADPALLAALLDLDTVAVGQALDALAQSGLLSSGRFRHEAAQEAILADLDPDERRDLHLRTARWRYQTGAEPRVITRHLVGADGTAESWALPVLLAAADQALAENRLEEAVESLRHAATASPDGPQITAALCRVEWRLDPGLPLRHLPRLLAALRERRLREEDTHTLLRLLLWHGRGDDATAALIALGEHGEGGRPPSPWLLSAVGTWLANTHPPFAGHLESLGEASAQELATDHPQLQADRALRAVLRGRAHDQAVGQAEHVLRGSTPEGVTLDGIVPSLFTLVYADELNRAAAWCDALLGESAVASAPTWQAMLGAIRAEIALRQGDPALAEAHAEAALAKVAPRAWGTSAGLPVGALLLAQTQLRRYDRAAAQLSRALPAESFQSRYGLHFLHARGQYYLATERPTDALADFVTCGRLVRRWQIDRPGFLPWRIGAANVHLVLGDAATARHLAQEQLGLPGGDRARTGGMALRALAAASDPGERPELLRHAIGELQECGDRMELALALNDLSHALHGLGESARARTVAHLSWKAVKDARGRGRSTGPRRHGSPSTASPGSAATVAASLSEAEQRVAELAALGLTNRQISERLYVTVSTVEQHLTRVYRKLRLNGRTELSSAFRVSY